jgi:hypothetical protein
MLEVDRECRNLLNYKLNNNNKYIHHILKYLNNLLIVLIIKVPKIKYNILLIVLGIYKCQWNSQ